MKRWYPLALSLAAIIIAAQASLCQAADSTSIGFQWPGTAVATALSCIRLTPSDLTLRSDYVPRDSCRLPMVDSLMAEPRLAPAFLEYAATVIFPDSSQAPMTSAQQWPNLLPFLTGVDASPEYAPDTNKPLSIPTGPFESSPEWMAMLRPLQAALAESGWIDTVLGGLSAADRQFVLDRTPEFLLEDEADKDKPAEYLDSLQKVEEQDAARFAALAGNIHWSRVQTRGSAILHELLPLIPQTPPRALTKATVIQQLPAPLGAILLGTPGADEFTGDAVLIIDPGGDDRYTLSPLEPGKNRLIIDYGGDDDYSAPQGCDLGAARFGWSVLIDRSGNDLYRAGSYSLGAGWFGIGALFDLNGRDEYSGDIFTEGAGAFGIGILCDGGDGNDQYTGRLFGQGMGFAAGLGILADAGGNDIYTAGGKYEDIIRYRDHYVSLSQGFGYGLRPYFSGGIGLLLDQNGNDIFIADIFGQGCSYWCAFGGMYDGGGNDHYIAYQYAQGSATHLTSGCLLDVSGDDRYESKGVSQGCGHDWSSGMLIDLSGNDRYTATDLSQAAGSANGIGTLIDCAGDDGYYVVSSANTQGYGNPRREYGSIGLFLDLGGKDRYDGPGKDSTVWLSNSSWGVGVDADSAWLDKITEK